MCWAFVCDVLGTGHTRIRKLDLIVGRSCLHLLSRAFFLELVDMDFRNRFFG